MIGSRRRGSCGGLPSEARHFVSLLHHMTDFRAVFCAASVLCVRAAERNDNGWRGWDWWKRAARVGGRGFVLGLRPLRRRHWREVA